MDNGQRSLILMSLSRKRARANSTSCGIDESGGLFVNYN